MLLFIEGVGQRIEPAAVPSRTGVVNNSEEPGPAISAGKCPKIAKGPERCLLHDVFRIVLVPHQPARQTMSSVEMGQNDRVETRIVWRGGRGLRTYGIHISQCGVRPGFQPPTALGQHSYAAVQARR